MNKVVYSIFLVGVLLLLVGCDSLPTMAKLDLDETRQHIYIYVERDTGDTYDCYYGQYIGASAHQIVVRLGDGVDVHFPTPYIVSDHQVWTFHEFCEREIGSFPREE